MNKIVLPKTLPKRKILSVDIGGTLAKTVFFVPKDDPVRSQAAIFEKIREDTITSKLR